MGKLFWGFILILFDFKLSFELALGSSTLHFLPEWLGYILLTAGCSQLERECELFGKARPFCYALAAVNAFIWMGDLLGLSLGTNVFGILFNFALLCLHLYVVRMIINAIAQTEIRRHYNLSAAYLRRVWAAVAVSAAAALLLIWIPYLAVVAAVAASIASIIFLFAFHSTRKAYEQMEREYARGF